MRVYNGKYRVRTELTAIGDTGCVYAVEYKRKGWFKKWKPLLECRKDDFYDTCRVAELVPVYRGVSEDAEVIALRVTTEAMLDHWNRAERYKVERFWAKRQELHDTRHDPCANYPFGEAKGGDKRPRL